MCTTVGILALSLLVNVYLLLVRSNDVTISDCCDKNKPTDYLPLRSNHLASSSSPDKNGNHDCDLTREQCSSRDVTISASKTNAKIEPSVVKTRPYSMSDHRKIRGKRKSRDLRGLSGFSKNVVYEETALLSES